MEKLDKERILNAMRLNSSDVFMFTGDSKIQIYRKPPHGGNYLGKEFSNIEELETIISEKDVQRIHSFIKNPWSQYFQANFSREMDKSIRLRMLENPDRAEVALLLSKISWLGSKFPGFKPMAVWGSATITQLVSKEGVNCVAVTFPYNSENNIVWVSDQRKTYSANKKSGLSFLTKHQGYTLLIT